MTAPNTPTREQLTDFLKKNNLLDKFKSITDLTPEQIANVRGGEVRDDNGRVMATLTRDDVLNFLKDPVGVILSETLAMQKEMQKDFAIIRSMRVFVSTIEFFDAHDFISFLKERHIIAEATDNEESYVLGELPGDDFQISKFLDAAYRDYVRLKK